VVTHPTGNSPACGLCAGNSRVGAAWMSLGWEQVILTLRRATLSLVLSSLWHEMPGVMKRPPGTCTFEHRHPQSTNWILPESSRKNNYLISYEIPIFKKKLQSVKVADYRTTRTTKKSPVTTVTPRSPTKTPEMDRKDNIVSFRLPSCLFWFLISSQLCDLRT
jgi:hypothetical protein